MGGRGTVAITSLGPQAAAGRDVLRSDRIVGDTTVSRSIQPASGFARAAWRRRGSVYVLALGASMAVVSIGIAAAVNARLQHKALQGAGDALDARHYAHSAIEIGFVLIRTNSLWRTAYGDGVWVASRSLGRGSFKLEATTVSDADADPDNNPVILSGTGFAGVATHKTQVTLVRGSGGKMTVAAGSWKHVPP